MADEKVTPPASDAQAVAAKAAAEEARKAAEAEKAAVTNPATATQKIVAASLLVALTLAVLVLWWSCFDALENRLQDEHAASWTRPSELVLEADSPESFAYDAGEGRILHRGPMSSETKAKVARLLVHPDPDETPSAEELSVYRSAVDQLAFASNEGGQSRALLLLLLGGLSGLIGVNIRSIMNFIGHACFKETLDLVIWWPWYSLRPVLGFLLGGFSVILVEANLLEGTPSGTGWWVALALLAGFGASDFIERLRLLTQTLFGKGK